MKREIEKVEEIVRKCGIIQVILFYIQISKFNILINHHEIKN
jgi:hypothetical protein